MRSRYIRLKATWLAKSAIRPLQATTKLSLVKKKTCAFSSALFHKLIISPTRIISLNRKMSELEWAQASSSEPFCYDPLDTSRKEIRLLCVYQNQAENIEGCLETFDVSHAPRHLAVSYTWGSEKVMRRVCINDRALFIRSNLYQFFEVYKTRHLGQWLWVDQVR